MQSERNMACAARNFLRLMVALAALSGATACEGEVVLAGNFRQWEVGWPGGALPGDPEGDSVQLARDPSLANPIVGRVYRSVYMLFESALGRCSPADCAVRFHSAAIPSELREEPFSWEFAIGELHIQPGQTLEVILARDSGAPLLVYRFREEPNGAILLQVEHASGTLSRVRRYGRDELIVNTTIAPGSDGTWQAFTPAGAAELLHAPAGSRLSVILRWSTAPAPSSSWGTFYEMAITY